MRVPKKIEKTIQQMLDKEYHGDMRNQHLSTILYKGKRIIPN